MKNVWGEEIPAGYEKGYLPNGLTTDCVGWSLYEPYKKETRSRSEHKFLQKYPKKNPERNWAAVIVKHLGANCIYCGDTKKLHIHHIIPLSRGGPNEMGNLEIVCIKCHKNIHQQWRKLIPRHA